MQTYMILHFQILCGPIITGWQDAYGSWAIIWTPQIYGMQGYIAAPKARQHEKYFYRPLLARYLEILSNYRTLMKTDKSFITYTFCPSYSSTSLALLYSNVL